MRNVIQDSLFQDMARLIHRLGGENGDWTNFSNPQLSYEECQEAAKLWHHLFGYEVIVTTTSTEIEQSTPTTNE